MKTLPAYYLDFSLLLDLNFYASREQRLEGGGGRGEKKGREAREQWKMVTKARAEFEFLLSWFYSQPTRFFFISCLLNAALSSNTYMSWQTWRDICCHFQYSIPVKQFSQYFSIISIYGSRGWWSEWKKKSDNPHDETSRHSLKVLAIFLFQYGHSFSSPFVTQQHKGNERSCQRNTSSNLERKDIWAQFVR